MGSAMISKQVRRHFLFRFLTSKFRVPAVESDYYPHRAELFEHLFPITLPVRTEDKMGIKQLKKGNLCIFLPYFRCSTTSVSTCFV